MTTLNRLDQLLHTAERGRPLDVDSQGRVPVRLYGPDGQPLFTESNPAHVKGEVTLTGSIPTLGGLSTDPKPTPDPEDRVFFYEQDTGELYYWDGSDWVVS